MMKTALDKLTDAAVKNAKPKAKPYKLADGGGLFLLVVPGGGKYWRLKFRVNGKEKLLALGIYPTVSLAKARKERNKAREQLVDGKNPIEEIKREKIAKDAENANTFEAIAREWSTKKSAEWAPTNIEKVTWLLEKNLFPWLGENPIASITAPEILKVLQRIENRGALETAHRAKQLCGQVFRYAIATGRAERNPAADLKDALSKPRTKHHAAIIEPKKLPALLHAMDNYAGSLVVSSALKLSLLLFVRPGELRHMEWTEVDLEKAEWNIPAHKMKMKQPHLVPLCRQAVEIIETLRPLIRSSKYVLPSERGQGRPMSENTVNVALRTLGYDNNTQTAHGFRATARTILDEVLGVRPDFIEHQLAHSVRDPNGRAYNRTAHLPERRKMMQQWADYLDKLKIGNVIPVNFDRSVA